MTKRQWIFRVGLWLVTIALGFATWAVGVGVYSASVIGRGIFWGGAITGMLGTLTYFLLWHFLLWPLVGNLVERLIPKFRRGN